MEFYKSQNQILREISPVPSPALSQAATPVFTLHPEAYEKGSMRSSHISITWKPVRNAEPESHPGPTKLESSFYQDSQGVVEMIKCVKP